MKEQLGLVIDVPKSGGSRTSNDRNTGRRFFENAQIVSSITGFDLHLIKMIHVVLQKLSSGLLIDPDAFQVYCINVANRYVELYLWYYIPRSLHHILMHGHEDVRQFSLPIGLLSEEVQESHNKDFKKFQENFLYKCS